jgi:uridine kinase
VSRLSVVEELAARISALSSPARIGVDGVDAAGKTTLADELAGHLPEAARLAADDFLRPPVERYRQGRESPMGYYEDSFDNVALRAAVLAAQRLVIVDGIFLFRPELNDLWTFRILLHVELEESIRRGIERDGAGKEELYRRRYAPGQRLYLDAVRPAELADVILDNTDPDDPRLSPGGADRHS